MKKYSPLIISLNLLFLLIYFNSSVIKKEHILKEGTLVLLKLAPVDPRSLMQGDYMTLNYDIAADLTQKDIAKRGYFIVQLDSKGVANRIRIQENTKPLKEGEHAINYTAINRWSVSIGANSYFFQEGDAEKYQHAKYGGVKLDENGNSLLVGLYDEQRRKIE